MSTFSVVLFDLDGTLIDTNGLIVHTFQHILKAELGLQVSPEELYPYFGEPLPVTMARWCAERAEELAEKYRAHNVAHHDALVREFPGVAGAVAQLHGAGIQLGVVTSKRRQTALLGLRVFGLEPYFQTLVGMDETEHHKPHPEPALLALQRLGAEPGPQVLMVGDSRFDILCGRSAGLKTAAVGWTVQKRTELSAVGPDFWIEQAADLVRLVLGA